MHIFLTGGTGFIGSNLIQLALDQKHEITAIKRNAESKPRIVLTKQPKWITKKFSELNKNEHIKSPSLLIHFLFLRPLPLFCSRAKRAILWDLLLSYVFLVVSLVFLKDL